jgi:tRNA pseudouridine38-40 synthase
MNNIKIIMSYDGSPFFGYAKQPHKYTVQGELENVFNSLGITLGHENRLIASGRTDRGVHATTQVLTLKVPHFWIDKLDELKSRLNITLPSSINISQIKKVNDNFHARFSAKKRIYRYIVCDEVSVFEANYITKFDLRGKEEIINQAIKELVGTYDFRYFSKEEKEKNTTRTISKILFYKREFNHKTYYIFSIYANSFLRNQIRLIVEFLFKISDGSLDIEDLKSQLNCQKQINSKKAPPNGLYLARVIY